MDVFQDKLTDRLFGDLVLKGKICKIADNIYFKQRHTIISHYNLLRNPQDSGYIRPKNKTQQDKIHIQSANILGLLWERGTLTPSRHKLDPLAHCDKPNIVKGLCSFLGAVRFNQLCLNRTKLAAATHLLDQEATFHQIRKGKHCLDSCTYPVIM